MSRTAAAPLNYDQALRAKSSYLSPQAGREKRPQSSSAIVTFNPSSASVIGTWHDRREYSSR